MKLENQVCSLELAKRLKELGIKQDSLWWWYSGGYSWNRWVIVDVKPNREDSYSAFTVAELGKMLPYKIKRGIAIQWINIGKSDIIKRGMEWWVYYGSMYSGNFIAQDKHLVNAMAKMLIYLKEKGLK